MIVGPGRPTRTLPVASRSRGTLRGQIGSRADGPTSCSLRAPASALHGATIVRLVYAAAAVLLLAGCGSTAGSSPKPTPTPPPSASSTQFKHAPAMTINSNASYSATMATSDGTFTIQLLPKVAPVTVNNFVFLAR